MITGFHPPIPTPFLDGEICPSRLAENIARWEKEPIDGYVVLGSNGEAPLLDEHERQAIVRAAWEAVSMERRLIVGAGRESTRATLRAVKEAFDLGADAVLVGVPSYYKPEMTDDVLEAHLRRVADASPGPVLLYSVPAFTGLPIGADLFSRLLDHERIVGIKDSSGDPETAASLVAAAARAGREVSVLIGSARALARGLLAGASGAVLAVDCVAPRHCAAIAADVSEGRAARARERNEALAPLAWAVTRAHGIGGLKAALELLGMHGGPPRPPLPTAGEAARLEIEGLMRDLGLLG